MMSDRQAAAMCTARLFQGHGHEIWKKQDQRMDDKLTSAEESILKDAFDLFLGLIQGRVEEVDPKAQKDLQKVVTRGL